MKPITYLAAFLLAYTNLISGRDRLKWIEPVDHLVPYSTSWGWEDFPENAIAGTRVYGGLGLAFGWYLIQEDRKKEEYEFILWNEKSPDGYASITLSSGTKEELYSAILQELLKTRYPDHEIEDENVFTLTLDKPWTQFMIAVPDLGLLQGEIIHNGTASDRILSLSEILYDSTELQNKGELTESSFLRVIKKANKSAHTTPAIAPR